VLRAAVLADTHIREGSTRRLPDAAVRHVGSADVILHAGDVVSGELLDWLATMAPVHAVLGNNDHGLADRLPATLELDLDGVRVAMVHDSGPRAGRPARLRRRFPEASVVVFGHSHLPCCEAGVDGQLLLNPGSATERRQAPTHTMGLLDLHNGRVVGAQLVALD
jgi:uncharacterized protein